MYAIRSYYDYSIDLTVKANWFSPILKISKRVAYTSMPVNCAFIIAYQIRDLVKEIKNLINHKSDAQSEIKEAEAK